MISNGVILDKNVVHPSRGEQVTITISAKDPAHITARVYNIALNASRSLYDQDNVSGVVTVTWDGRTEGGGPAANDVYLIVVKIGSDRFIKKIAVSNQ